MMATQVTLSVATWNVRQRARPQMLDLVKQVAPDVLLLQEVTPTTWPGYRDLDCWGGSAFGLDLHARRTFEGTDRRLGAALLVRHPLTVAGPAVIDEPDIERPERVVCGTVALACCGEQATAVSYHALNGESGMDGLAKPRTSLTLGRWLEAQHGPVLAGMDANSPDIDHPDESQMECHFAQQDSRHMERALNGPERRHRLSDVWRTYLSEHPGQKRGLSRYQPTGPLAITHMTGRGAVRIPRRYDHIWVTPDFNVFDVRHMHEGFVAGSDHALVVARLAHRCAPG
jgi:endonuclease/exonuclease/phosphatase family metal-dependent hydrolase